MTEHPHNITLVRGRPWNAAWHWQPLGYGTGWNQPAYCGAAPAPGPIGWAYENTDNRNTPRDVTCARCRDGLTAHLRAAGD